VGAAEVGETVTAPILARHVDRTRERPFARGRRGLAIGPRVAADIPRSASLPTAGRIDEARDTASSMRAVAARFRVDPFISRYPLTDPARTGKLPR
jgi:hypothetical protein